MGAGNQHPPLPRPRITSKDRDKVYRREKVCFASPGKDRPKEFSAKKGTGQLLHVWKCDKP